MKKSTKTFIVTDENFNVYGFKVRSSGIKMDRFFSNPVCTLNHNYEKIIGLWPDMQMEGTKWLGIPSFDENDPEALKIADKIEQGIIKTASIGILPIRVEGEWVEESELLEIAIAPVPGNKNAMVKLYSSEGIALSDSDAKKLLLSVTQTQLNINPENLKESMTEKQRMAFIALCMQAGLTMNLNATSSDEEVIATMQKVGEKITSLNLTVQQLTTAENLRVKAEKDAIELEVKTSVDLAITNKIATADERDDLIQLGAFNPKLLKSTLDKRKPVALSVVIPGQQDGKVKQEESADRAAWTFKDFLEKDGVALSAMQVNDPGRFNTLYSAYQIQLKVSGAIA